MFGTAPLNECTSFALQPDVTANRHTYVGQNWDWAPDIKETLNTYSHLFNRQEKDKAIRRAMQS